MNALEKRDYIHSYLHCLDDVNINEMFEKVQSFVEKDFVLTSKQEAEVEKRVMRHKNGESKSYSWDEVKQKAKL